MQADLKYEAIPHLTRVQVEALLRSSESADIQRALLCAAMFEPDPGWAESVCLAHLGHADPNVRAAAVTGLSHVARIYGALDLDKVLPKLAELRSDPIAGGRVCDAMDDIEMFVRQATAEHK